VVTCGLREVGPFCIDFELGQTPSQLIRYWLIAIECNLKYALLAVRLLSAASDRLVQHTAAKLASTPNNPTMNNPHMTTNPIVRAQTCASLQLSTFQCQYRGGQGLRCKVVFSAIAEVANWPLQGLSYCCCLQLCTSGTTTMSMPQGQKG
jgi:hypothetical protein